MTETTFTSPRLERPHEAPLGGVASALARTTGTDVVLWRVLFVVLTVFGGLGLALYLACYVTIPAEGQPDSLVSRLLHGPDRRVTTRQVLLLALVVVAAGAALHDNGGAVVVAGLAALGYVWWRRRSTPDASLLVAPSAGPVPAAAPSQPVPPAGAVGVPGAVAPAPPLEGFVPPAQPPRRSRSVVTALTLSAASLAVGVLLLVAASGAASVPTDVVLAVALGVVGLGLVASAWLGRARGLVPVALLLALALGATVAARPALDHGLGERTWVAQAPHSYRLGIGDATLTVGGDLSHDDALKRVDARVSIGHLLVVVPEGIRVVVDARATTGDIQGPGVDDSGRRVHRTFTFGPEGAPQVRVDARVGAGMVEVRRG